MVKRSCRLDQVHACDRSPSWQRWDHHESCSDDGFKYTVDRGTGDLNSHAKDTACRRLVIQGRSESVLCGDEKGIAATVDQEEARRQCQGPGRRR
jgi:hypothetical protein